MEQTLGKPRMLQLYLAHAPWGRGLCGSEAAARHYFSRPTHQLSPTQAAWLAAMLHGMRSLPRAQRNRLADDVPQLKWVAPAAPQSAPATLLN